MKDDDLVLWFCRTWTILVAHSLCGVYWCVHLHFGLLATRVLLFTLCRWVRSGRGGFSLGLLPVLVSLKHIHEASVVLEIVLGLDFLFLNRGARPDIFL